MPKSSSLLKNTAFLYLRMFLVMGIGVFTTRKVLEALGVEDLGIYNVVGSLIIMFDFVSSGLSNSTQRFISLGLGKKDTKLTNQYFSQSFFIHLLFALVIAAIAEPVGIWIVKNKLVIPSGRMYAAIAVFHISVVSLIFRFVKICFESDIIAHEKMSIYAYMSLFEAGSKLLICFAIIYNESFDKLIFYASLLLTVNILITIFNVIYCWKNYSETKIRFYREKNVFKQLLSFVGVNSIGVAFWAIGKQGLDVVMNLFFGPAVNGAKALATQLDRVILQFGGNVDTALRPRITLLYAQGNIKEMTSLALKSTKYIYFIMLIVSVPFLFETERLLTIWLKNVPPFTISFVQILVFEQIFEATGRAFNSVSMAIGKIKNIQIYGRLLTLSALPLSYIISKFDPNPHYPLLIMVSLTLAYTLYIVYDVNKSLRFGLSIFFKEVLLPVTFVSIVSFICCYAIKMVRWQGNEIVVFCINSAICVGLTSLFTILWGVDETDKKYLVKLLKNKLKMSA